MKKRLVNLGIIGLGEQFSDNILPAIASIDTLRIQAICDINQQRLEHQARRLNVIGYTDFKEMIANEQLDGVVAVAYPQTHYEVIKVTAENNIPVLVEKPPVENLPQLKDLLSYRNQNSSPVLIGLNFGFSEAFIKLRETIEDQGLGDILSVTVVHYADKPKDSLWGLSKIRSMLLAQVIHPLGLLLELGSINSLKNVEMIENDSGLFMSLAINMVDYRGREFTANIVTGSSAPYFNWSMSVYGSRGIASIDSLNELRIKSDKDSKWWSRVWHGSPVMSGVKRSGFKQELERFTDAITGKGTTYRGVLDNLLEVYVIIDELEQAYARK